MLTLNVFNLSQGQNCKNSSYEFLYKRQWGIKGRGPPLSQGLDDHPQPQSEGHYPPLK